MSGLGKMMMMIGCAGALAAPAQTTFIMHMDSVQEGFEGAALDIEETLTGFLVVGHQDASVTPYPPHTFIRILSSTGQVTSQKEYFENDVDWTGFTVLDHIQIAGQQFVGALTRATYAPPPNYNYVVYFAKYDAQGDTLALLPIYTPLPDSVIGIVNQTRLLQYSGFAMVGSFHRANEDRLGWLIRLDDDGDTLWTRYYGAADQNTEFWGLAQYRQSGFLLAGVRLQGFVEDDYLLIRTDSLGNEIWRRHFGGETPPGIPAVRIAPDSTIITWTRFRNDLTAPPNECALNLRKWDANGTVVWNKLTEARAQDMDARDLEVLPDGSIICGANYFGWAGLWKFDANGDSLWLRTYSYFPGIGGGYSLVYDVLPTSDGGFAMCGEVDQGPNGPHPNLQTWFVIKTDSLGCVVPGCQYVGLEESVMGLEDALTAFPNPSDGRFSLALTLPETLTLSGDLVLQVFDVQGRLVERRNLGRQLQQTVALDLIAQPSGLYSAHLSDGRRILSGVRLVVE